MLVTATLEHSLQHRLQNSAGHKESSGSLISGEKVTISAFGTFTISQRREFKGYNPRNGKEIDVPARKIPVFRAGKALKEALNPNG